VPEGRDGPDVPDRPDLPHAPAAPSAPDGPRDPPAADARGAGDGDDGYDWLTPQRVARILGVSVRQVYRLVDRGLLPAYRIGGAIRLLADDVDTFRRNQSQGGEG
jgi:excisionase family DNA binding protein